MDQRDSRSADHGFAAFVELMARLRAPGGCPWDRKQTAESLKPYVLEEAYEVVAAIEQGDPREICEELGDLLLQVVFHSQLAQHALEQHPGPALFVDPVRRQLVALEVWLLLAVSSFIRLAISAGATSSLWVATAHECPNGSFSLP